MCCTQASRPPMQSNWKWHRWTSISEVQWLAWCVILAVLAATCVSGCTPLEMGSLSSKLPSAMTGGAAQVMKSECGRLVIFSPQTCKIHTILPQAAPLMHQIGGAKSESSIVNMGVWLWEPDESEPKAPLCISQRDAWGSTSALP